MKTGYKVRTPDGSAGVCTECQDEFGIPSDISRGSVRMSEWGTGNFADLACFACAKNISTRGDTELSPRHRNQDPDAVATLLNEAENLSILATLIPDETLEDVHIRGDDGTPVAKTVRPSPSADYLIHVMVDRYDETGSHCSASEMENRARKIERILRTAGYDVVGGAAPTNLDDHTQEWEVTAEV